MFTDRDGGGGGRREARVLKLSAASNLLNLDTRMMAELTGTIGLSKIRDLSEAIIRFVSACLRERILIMIDGPSFKNCFDASPDRIHAEQETNSESVRRSSKGITLANNIKPSDRFFSLQDFQKFQTKFL